MASSSFSPILDSDAFVGLIFRAPERHSPDWAVLRILEAYLHEHLYNVLRVHRGLAYAPGATTASLRTFGLFATYADVYVEDMDTAIHLIEDAINQILDGDINKIVLEKLKRGLLLSEARKYERNADIAEHYAESRFSLAANGELQNDTERLAAVTADDLQRLAREYLRVDQGVVLRVAPTLTYSQLFWSLGALLTVLFLLRARRWLRRWNASIARARERARSEAREKALMAGIQRKLAPLAAQTSDKNAPGMSESLTAAKKGPREPENRLLKAAAFVLLIFLTLAVWTLSAL